MCSGFVRQSNTSAAGASKLRSQRTSVSFGRLTLSSLLVVIIACPFSFWFVADGPLCGPVVSIRRLLLQLAQVGIELREAAFPVPAVLLDPVVDLLERRGLQATGTPLGLPPL